MEQGKGLNEPKPEAKVLICESIMGTIIVSGQEVEVIESMPTGVRVNRKQAK